MVAAIRLEQVAAFAGIRILAHCTGPDGRSVPGAPPLGPLTQLARLDAHRNIPPAVVAIREFWAPSRYNRRP